MELLEREQHCALMLRDLLIQLQLEADNDLIYQLSKMVGQADQLSQHFVNMQSSLDEVCNTAEQTSRKVHQILSDYVSCCKLEE